MPVSRLGLVAATCVALVSATSTAAVAASKEDPGEAAEALFLQAEKAAEAGQHRRAAELFLRVYREHSKSPEAPESLFRLANSLRALGQVSIACKALEEAKVFASRVQDATRLEGAFACSTTAVAGTPQSAGVHTSVVGAGGKWGVFGELAGHTLQTGPTALFLTWVEPGEVLRVQKLHMTDGTPPNEYVFRWVNGFGAVATNKQAMLKVDGDSVVWWQVGNHAYRYYKAGGSYFSVWLNSSAKKFKWNSPFPVFSDTNIRVPLEIIRSQPELDSQIAKYDEIRLERERERKREEAQRKRQPGGFWDSLNSVLQPLANEMTRQQRQEDELWRRTVNAVQEENAASSSAGGTQNNSGSSGSSYSAGDSSQSTGGSFGAGSSGSNTASSDHDSGTSSVAADASSRSASSSSGSSSSSSSSSGGAALVVTVDEAGRKAEEERRKRVAADLARQEAERRALAEKNARAQAEYEAERRREAAEREKFQAEWNARKAACDAGDKSQCGAVASPQ